VFNSTLSGSEDLALDGLGHLAGKDGTQVVLLDSQGASTVLASGIGTAYGLRFMLGGDLLVALPSAGTIKRITPQGSVTDFATGLNTPNGIFPDLAGNIWVTEFGGSRVVRFASTGGSPTIIASGQPATSANGVVFDSARGALFFTNYSNGGIKRVPIAQDGTPGSAVQVTTINGNPDGLALDACGHLYVVDQGNDRLFRVRLDAAGAAVGNPVILATFANNVANAQFGRGAGFSPTSLYLAGNPGTVYALDVGVTGAAIP
jgi:DNA-binding beta-propeller fold protein YncE